MWRFIITILMITIGLFSMIYVPFYVSDIKHNKIKETNLVTEKTIDDYCMDIINKTCSDKNWLVSIIFKNKEDDFFKKRFSSDWLNRIDSYDIKIAIIEDFNKKVKDKESYLKYINNLLLSWDLQSLDNFVSNQYKKVSYIDKFSTNYTDEIVKIRKMFSWHDEWVFYSPMVFEHICTKWFEYNIPLEQIEPQISCYDTYSNLLEQKEKLKKAYNVWKDIK